MKKRTCYSALILSLFMYSAHAQTANTAPIEKPVAVELSLPRVDINSFQKNSEGAYVIFDGTSLRGWRGYNKENVPNRWVIEDGALKFSKDANVENPEGGDLVFAYDFKEFELSFEWKISHKGNSGVFFLAKEIKGQPIYISSPEFQVIDNQDHPDAKMGVDGNRKSSSLYDMLPANPQNANPVGEWNTSKIIVKGNLVQHFQNGVKVVEYTIGTKEWTELLQKSKFSEDKWPLAFSLLNNVGGDSKSGLIGLQDHGDDVWYRNITVKEL